MATLYGNRTLASDAGECARWYPLLVDRGDGGQCALGRERFRANENFLACMDVERDGKVRKMFAVFGSPTNAFAWLAAIDPRLRCMYEVITQDAAQKPYFDIDISAEDFERTGATRAAIDAEVCEFARCAARIACLPGTEAAVYSSHSETGKMSYHVVVQGVSLRNHEASSRYCTATIDAAKEAGLRFVPDAVDRVVYKRIQQLRVVGSRKHGAEDARVKVFREDLSTVPALTGKTADLKEFLRSLVTHGVASAMEPADTSPAYYSEQVRRAPLKTVEVDDEIVARALERIEALHARKGVEFPFDVRFPAGPHVKIEACEGFIVSLCRREGVSSECIICERVHDHEHAYIIVRMDTKTAHFRCRRDDQHRDAVVSIKTAEEELFSGFETRAPPRSAAEETLFYGFDPKPRPPPRRRGKRPPIKSNV